MSGRACPGRTETKIFQLKITREGMLCYPWKTCVKAANGRTSFFQSAACGPDERFDSSRSVKFGSGDFGLGLAVPNLGVCTTLSWSQPNFRRPRQLSLESLGQSAIISLLLFILECLIVPVKLVDSRVRRLGTNGLADANRRIRQTCRLSILWFMNTLRLA